MSFGVTLLPVPKRRHILILLACGLAVVLYAILSIPREPSYKNRRLSTWAERLDSMDDGEAREAAEAIRQIGTNAVPFLMARIRGSRIPPWKMKIGRAGEALGIHDMDWPAWFYGEKRLDVAASALEVLGPNAKQAIPELATLANDTREGSVAPTAIRMLGHLGPEAMPALLLLLTNQSGMFRGTVAYAIHFQGTTAGPAVPLLLQYLSSTNNENLANEAARTLGVLALQPELVVPALSNALHNPRPLIRRTAVRALGRFATNNAAARPALAIALADPEASVRALATYALLTVAPDYLTNAPPK